MKLFKVTKLVKKVNHRYAHLFIFLIVLYFTFVIRAHNYDRIPGFGHLEEMLYAWSGIYLVQTGSPVSWSTLDYPPRSEVFKGEIGYETNTIKVGVNLYRPWLDEPPVFSLLVGWFAHIFGAERDQIIPPAYMRFPVIFISAITSILVFLVARLVSGYWTGILAMLIYGLTPIMVFGSRLAVPENLIAMLFMLTIYLLLKFHQTLKIRYVLVIPLLVGIAGLSKPTGYFIAPFAIFMVFMKKYYKTSLYLLLATIPFVALFFAYGLYYDPEIFWRITGIQAYRPVGFSSLGWFFVSPAYDITTVTDSWYIFCLLSAAYFIFAPKKGLEFFISLAFIYWVMVVMISGGEADLLPWYRYPVFPLLSILGAWGFQLLISKGNIFSAFFAFGMLLGNRFLLVNAFRQNIQPIEYRVIFTSLMLPSALNLVLNKDWLTKITRIMIIAVIVIAGYLNAVYIYNRFDLECQSKSCEFGPQNSLSTMHFPILWRFFVLASTDQ